MPRIIPAKARDPMESFIASAHKTAKLYSDCNSKNETKMVAAEGSYGSPHTKRVSGETETTIHDFQHVTIK